LEDKTQLIVFLGIRYVLSYHIVSTHGRRIFESIVHLAFLSIIQCIHIQAAKSYHVFVSSVLIHSIYIPQHM